MKTTLFVLSAFAAVFIGAHFAASVNEPPRASERAAPVVVTAPPPPVLMQEAAAAPATSAPPPSLSAHVDALMRARPVDALVAFKLLAACAQQKTHAACGDISPGQIASRRVALYRAAEAGVHGAAFLVAGQGPDDYQVHRVEPADPVFREWNDHRRKALEAGARTGDLFSLQSLAQIAESPIEDGGAADPALALMYWTAVAVRDGRPAYAKQVDRRAKELPPDIAQKAIADGRLLAQAFKPEGDQQ